MKKKAQAWGFDLMMALVIFTFGIVLFFIYSFNYPRQSEETLDSLRFEGEFIAQNLISQGHPDDWTEQDVVAIGLTNKNKINQTKLDRLYAMASTQQGYAKAKSLLNTKYEFFFKFSQPMQITNNPSPVGGIGSDYVGKTHSNLIRMTRVTIYNDQPVTMYLYIWDI